VIYINNLLSSLNEACKKYPLEEKVLIVPGYSQGHELCEALARGGEGWINLRSETTAGLAHQVAGEDLAEKGITYLTGILTTAVFEEIYHGLEEQKALLYFARDTYSPGLVRALASSIYELRYCGITGDTLDPDSFVSKDKGQDMAALLKAYEQYLADHRFIDSPGLLSLALDLFSKRTPTNTDTIYLLPSFLQLAPLERRLIELLTAGRLMILNADPVYGLSRPGMEPQAPVPENVTVSPADVERLPWLYQVSQSPAPVGDGSLSVFHAYGLMNEAREILRRITKEGIPLDSAAVACTSSEYIPVFYSLARRLGLNVTYGEGIPGSLTGPGRVLQGLVEWIRSDYSASTLKALVLSGDIALRWDKEGGAFLAPAAAARMLSVSGVGWGRDRYILLKNMAETFKEKAVEELSEEDDADGRRERYLRRRDLAEGLYTAISGLISNLPVPDEEGRISFRDLNSGLSYILSEITSPSSSIEAAALQGLISSLVQAGQFASFNLETEEALERVENILGDFRVGASGPKPGHLHIVSYANLTWSCRPNTFVAGLGADAFPGSARQDPVLLDTERGKIHAGLPLGAVRPAENQYMMALALAFRRGRVTLSFPSFDVAENRSVFPSNLMLQSYRLLQKDASLDYTDFINSLDRTAGYCPHEGMPALDETEWWAARVLTGPGVINGSAAVRDCCRGIASGSKALEARQSPDPTEYDGLIACDSRFDPRQNADLVMSCSRIEDLAGCPFAYFLKYILRVLPPDEVIYDPNCWLDALERGSLLHELFCKFMKKMAADKERPGLARHKAMMMEMADELIVEYRDRIPIPGELIFQRETMDIYRCCEVFLAAEGAQAAGDPVLFEVPFGLGGAAAEKSGAGMADPVKIKLGSGAGFLLRGKIDRVDKGEENTYQVWDYKTGSTYGYKDHKHFCGGRQVQHALYAVAAEQILEGLAPKSSPRAEVSGYYFPTERGEGLKIAYRQANRERLSGLLNHLFDLLAGGVFIAADHGEKCGICDYPAVCGGDRAVDRAKKLAAPGGSACLDPWRRLKEYD